MIPENTSSNSTVTIIPDLVSHLTSISSIFAPPEWETAWCFVRTTGTNAFVSSTSYVDSSISNSDSPYTEID